MQRLKLEAELEVAHAQLSEVRQPPKILFTSRQRHFILD
jgi:hypothetical protein